MSGRTRSTVVTASSTLPAFLDHDISTATALDPKELGVQLERLAVSQWRTALGELQVQVLKRTSTKRSTFKIVLRTDLIGKVYAEDRPDVYQVMEGIRR